MPLASVSNYLLLSGIFVAGVTILVIFVRITDFTGMTIDPKLKKRWSALYPFLFVSFLTGVAAVSANVWTMPERVKTISEAASYFFLTTMFLVFSSLVFSVCRNLYMALKDAVSLNGEMQAYLDNQTAKIIQLKMLAQV